MTEATAKAKKEVVKIPVVLTTGETVEFTERQRTIKSHELKDGHAKVRFAFKNGEVREFSFGKHHDLLMRLAIHGALQKIGDETAGVEDLDDQVAAVDAVITRLEGGSWEAEREGGGGFNGASIVLRAIAEVKGVDAKAAKGIVESILEKYKAQGKPITRQALYQTFRTTGKTAAVIKRMEEEKAAKAAQKTPSGPTADDLLADDPPADGEQGE